MEAQPARIDRSMHTCKFDPHSFGLRLDKGDRNKAAGRPVHELAAGKLDWEGGQRERGQSMLAGQPGALLPGAGAVQSVLAHIESRQLGSTLA